MNGEIFFDMTREQHPISGSSKYLLKRWQKYTIYARNGSYNTGSSRYVDAPFNNKMLTDAAFSGSLTAKAQISGSYIRNYDQRSQLYSTNSIYLYDYVVVSDKWFKELIYTASIVDTVASQKYDLVPPYNPSPPIYPVTESSFWTHRSNTFKNSPNAITNNYVYTKKDDLSIRHGRLIYDLPVILRDDGTFFEIVKGYPRNHYTHKRSLFSLFSMKTFGLENRKVTTGIYYRNRQTIDSTIGLDGIQDGSSPVQSIPVGNLNLIRTDNAINH